MANREIKVTLIGDADNLNRAFRDAGESAGGLGKHLGDMGKIAGGFVLAQGIMKAPGFLADAAQAAADDAANLSKLQKAVENTGAAWAEHANDIGKVVSAAQKRGFTDDQARNSLSLLTAQTGSAGEAQKRFALAMDLSRGAGIDLETASKLLGKVTAENVNVLGRYGITVAEGTSETELFGAIQAKFGGQAEAFANSTAGQMEAAKIGVGELQEQIGTALLPIMTALGQILLTHVIPALERLIAFIQENQKVFGVIAAVIGGVLVLAFTAWAVSAGAAAVATIAAAAPIIAIGAAVALLIAGIVLLVTNWDTITAKVPILGTVTDAVKVVLEAFTSFITGTLVPAIQSVVDFVVNNWGTVQTVIEAVMTALALIVQYQWDQIRVIFETAFGIIQGLLDVFIGVFTGDWDQAWNGIKQIAQSIWDGITGLIQNAVGAITGILNAFGVDVGAIWGAVRDTIGGIVDGIRDKVVGVFTDMVDTVKRLFNSMIDGINGVIGKINSALEFSVSIPGVDMPGPIPDIPGVSFSFDAPDIPSVPRLAHGGIVRARPGGTLALLGEGGRDEAVVPLGAGGRSFGNVYGNLQVVLPNVRSADDFFGGLDRMFPA